MKYKADELNLKTFWIALRNTLKIKIKKDSNFEKVYRALSI